MLGMDHQESDVGEVLTLFATNIFLKFTRRKMNVQRTVPSLAPMFCEIILKILENVQLILIYQVF